MVRTRYIGAFSSTDQLFEDLRQNEPWLVDLKYINAQKYAFSFYIKNSIGLENVENSELGCAVQRYIYRASQ